MEDCADYSSYHPRHQPSLKLIIPRILYEANISMKFMYYFHDNFSSSVEFEFVDLGLTFRCDGVRNLSFVSVSKPCVHAFSTPNYILMKKKICRIYFFHFMNKKI